MNLPQWPEAREVISGLIVVAFVGLVLLWMLHAPTGDPATLSLLNALIMVVGSAFTTVCNYYFGSSSGSKAKDDTIAHMGAVAQAQNTTLQNGNTSPVVEPTKL